MKLTISRSGVQRTSVFAVLAWLCLFLPLLSCTHALGIDYDVSGHRMRRLVMHPAVQEAGAEFNGIVLLNVTTRRLLCSGVMVGPNMLLTSPACFPADEAPATLLQDSIGNTKTLRNYEVSAFVAGQNKLIGYTTAHTYLYASGDIAFRISAVLLTRTDQPDEDLVRFYPLWKPNILIPATHMLVGFGANNFTIKDLVRVGLGIGTLRVANTTISRIDGSAKRIGSCSGFRNGGTIVDYETGNTPYVRMCTDFGDLGAGLLYRDAGVLYVAGVLQEPDEAPCSRFSAKFVSVPYRQEWIENAMRTLGGMTVPLENCPSRTPSPSAAPTVSVTATATLTPIVNASYIPPPIEREFPWWWVAACVGGVLLIVDIFVLAWCCAKFKQKRLSKITPFDTAAMAAPHPDHVVSNLSIEGGARTGKKQGRQPGAELARRMYQVVAKDVQDDNLDDEIEENKRRLKEGIEKQHLEARQNSLRFTVTKVPKYIQEKRQAAFTNSQTVLRPRFNDPTTGSGQTTRTPARQGASSSDDPEATTTGYTSNSFHE